MSLVTLARPAMGNRVAFLFARLRSRRLWVGLVAFLAVIYGAGRWVDSQFYPFARKDAATVLVIGADEPVHGRSRSDTMLLVHIQLRPVRRVTVTALPRDTRVRIPKHGTGYEKLNAAFADGGETCLKETLAANFGIVPDYTLTLLPEGMARVVDAVGGVQMDVPMAMNYDDGCQNLHIHLKSGMQHMDGAQAVQFVRFRKDGRGDIGRIERQKSFLRTVARQSLTFSNLLRWNQILPVLRQSVKTDLSDHQLIGLLYSLRGMQPEDLHPTVLAGHPEYVGGVSYYIPSGGNRERVPVTGTTASAPGWVVLNGTGRRGLARRVAHRLHAMGLKVARIGNVPGEAALMTSELRVAPGTETAALVEQVRNAIHQTARVIEDDQVPSGVVVLVLGMEDNR